MIAGRGYRARSADMVDSEIKLNEKDAVHIDSSLFVVSRALGKVAASPLLFSGGDPPPLVEQGDDVRGEHRHLADGRSRI
jgi:hypothetical protein